MNDVPIAEFLKAVQATHGFAAQLVRRHVVRETFRGAPVWEGEVLEFESAGPLTRTCYAWEVDGRITAVLREAPVDTPLAAVRAAIAAERAKGD